MYATITEHINSIIYPLLIVHITYVHCHKADACSFRKKSHVCSDVVGDVSETNLMYRHTLCKFV